MAHHMIVMDTAKANDYGITHRGRNVFDTTGSHSPTRLVAWDNTGRPNPRNGEPVRFGQYGPAGGGDGKYLDPHNEATDAPASLLLTPESTCITSSGTNTGTVASGQVFAPGRLADGDTATLSFPDGTTREAVLHFPPHRNGHGFATA